MPAFQQAVRDSLATDMNRLEAQISQTIAPALQVSVWLTRETTVSCEECGNRQRVNGIMARAPAVSPPASDKPCGGHEPRLR